MPIVMSKDQWSRIVRWTDEGREDPETARRREYLAYLHESSREMTKSWPNSLENVNQRNEETRRARVEAAEQVNNKFYRRYIKNKKEEQERLMYSARDIVFKNKDAPKFLLSAVIETVVQKEREEQVKFNAMIKHIEAEQKAKDDAHIFRKAKEWNDMQEMRKKKRFEVNKQNQKDILDQIDEMQTRQRREYEEELGMQIVDIKRANEEMEAIKAFDEEFKAKEKARIWNDMEKARQETEQRRREQSMRDRLDDDLINVLLRSRCIVEKKRRQTEKELREEKLRVLENISKRLESGDAARDAKEQAILVKAENEKLAAEEARRQANLQKAERIRKERQESRNQFLRDEAQRIHEKETMLSWDCMNRFKNQEIYEAYLETMRQRKAQKIKEFKENTLRLKRECEERCARERADTRHFYGELALQKLRDADNKLLAHAAALLEEARAHGRPQLALIKAIHRYCKMYKLYPAPKLPASLQKIFPQYAPQDGSEPDPWYREPPAPPPAGRPDTPEEHAPTDGLQDLDKAGPSKPRAEPPEENVQDYKRLGRANGLQRRPAMEDTTLPPITVIPCSTEACACELKDTK